MTAKEIKIVPRDLESEQESNEYTMISQLFDYD